jgi:hypothetical protein
VTIQTFGWRVYFRAVLQGQGKTFLSLLDQAGSFVVADSSEADLIKRCIGLELQARLIYESLAERFETSPPLVEFLSALAVDEQCHADLLRVCHKVALQGRFHAYRFSPWHDYLPLLERQMYDLATSLDSIADRESVARLVLQIESSEINSVFCGIIKATDSPFVKKLKPFRKAVRTHIEYICRAIPLLAPGGMLASRELRAKYL